MSVAEKLTALNSTLSAKAAVIDQQAAKMRQIKSILNAKAGNNDYLKVYVGTVPDVEQMREGDIYIEVDA